MARRCRAAAVGQIKCTLTGHEMPARLDALQEHLQSRKYLHAKATVAVDPGALPAHMVVSDKHPYVQAAVAGQPAAPAA